MKFRIEKNIVKFRLSPDEIELLNKDRALSDEILISGENSFKYTVQISDDSNNSSLVFSSKSVVASIPILQIDDWFNSNQIGIKEYIENDKGVTITLIVEEDLPRRKKPRVD